MLTSPSLSMIGSSAGFSGSRITLYVHFSPSATSSELNGSVFVPGYAGLLASLAIQDRLFELEMAAVEIKIVAGQQRYGRVWFGRIKIH